MAEDRPVSVRLQAHVAHYIAGMKAATRATGDLYREIDKTNDRTAWLAQGVLALAPAFTTFGAGAIPVVSGLATQFAIAGGAAGTMALAFGGVGDALGALNDFQLEPTSENLDQLTQALEKIGPAGAEFVRFLDEVGPKFTELRMTAREGMFPGVIEGIENFMRLLPELDRIVQQISEGLGELASNAGAALAGPRFEGFFNYLEDEAKPILIEMGRTFGNFIDGIAEMMVAFGPLTADFSSGFEEMSKSFADWAHGLETSQGFQEFVDYVQHAAPMALDFLGSLSMALVELAEAAAPVGDVALPLLTDLLDIISALANSPIGPAVIGFTALTSAIGRLAALGSITGSGAFGKITTGIRDNYTAARTAAPTFRQFGNALLYSAHSQDTLLKSMESSSRVVREGAANAMNARGQVMAFGRAFAPIAGQVGLAAVAMSDWDNKAGVANTTTFALMGSLMGGAPGAVAGGLVGAFMDLRKETNNAAEMQDRWNRLVSAGSTDVSQYHQTLVDARDKASELAAEVPTSFGDALLNAFDPDNIKMNWAAIQDAVPGIQGNLDDTDLGRQMDAANALRENYLDLQLAINEIGRVGFGTLPTDDVGELTTILDRAGPAMDALGISVADLMQGAKDGSIVTFARQIQRWTLEADTAEGRSRNLAQAVSDLDDDLLTTAESADALSIALENLLSPQLNLSEATDNWTLALRTLNEDLAKHSKTLIGNSGAALQNRDAIRGRVTDLMAMFKAQAEAGASSEELARSVRREREALLAAGEAAGLSRDQLEDYLTQLGLTPEVVRTLIQANTDEAMLKLRQLNETIDWVARPRQARITITQAYANADMQTLGGLQERADGGPILGQRYPYRDKVLVAAAPGEFMVSNRHGQADMNRAALEAANRGARLMVAGYADGGTIAHYDQRSYHASTMASVPAINLDSMRVVGTLQTPWGPAQIEGVARSAARSEIAADRTYQKATGPRDRTRRGHE